MNLANASVAQLLIPISDFDKGLAFYRVPPAGQAAQRGSAIYFKTEDIQAVCATLKDNGVRFGAEPHVVHRTPQMELWPAEFKDPDGNPPALMSEVSSPGGRP